MNRTQRYPTSIRISTTLRRRLQFQADRSGSLLSQTIVHYIEERLNQEEQLHPYRGPAYLRDRTQKDEES